MAGDQINTESKMDALEIEGELIEAIEEAGVGGLCFKDGCEIVGLDYDRFYLLVHQLERLSRVKIARSLLGNQARIILPDADPPALKMLTDKQQRILDVLCSVMDRRHRAQISLSQLAARSGGRSYPYDAIECLDKKGFLRFVKAGGPTAAAIYQIYPAGDGPRGHSWPRPR